MTSVASYSFPTSFLMRSRSSSRGVRAARRSALTMRLAEKNSVLNSLAIFSPRFLQQVVQQAGVVLLVQAAGQQLLAHGAGQCSGLGVSLTQLVLALGLGGSFALGQDGVGLLLGVSSSCCLSFSACCS